MSGNYTAKFEAVAITTAQDLFEVASAAAKPTVPISFDIGQTSDFGDAQAENLLVALRSGQTTTGSGGTTVTPTNNDPGSGAAASAVVKANNTTKASAGTIVTHRTFVWNVAIGLVEKFTQEEQILMAAGRRFTLELVNAPVDALTVSGTICFQEVG
jgi:hypothetical protein